MNIEKLILDQLKKRKKIKIADIVKKTGLSRAYIHRFFKELQDQEKIILMGKTDKAHYVLFEEKNIQKPLSFQRILTNENISEHIILEDIKRESDVFIGLKKSIVDILDYAFTEMLNNAIEHSKSKKILVQMNRIDKLVEFKVVDWGVGIFYDIRKKFKLKNIFEAIELLLKGKQTTAPEAHSGEGIFFTSKIADEFVIKSSNKKLIFDNKINDIFVRNIKETKGTKIFFKIFANHKKKLLDVFKEFTNENFVFDRTRVIVKLFELSDQSYVSRSQAHRLLFGLEKFQKIILDFKKVKTVGQAFTDEIFRVWHKKYPKIKIAYINSNENIEFMIKRSMTRL